jgi:hypothetical protein
VRLWKEKRPSCHSDKELVDRWIEATIRDVSCEAEEQARNVAEYYLTNDGHGPSYCNEDIAALQSSWSAFLQDFEVISKEEE